MSLVPRVESLYFMSGRRSKKAIWAAVLLHPLMLDRGQTGRCSGAPRGTKWYYQCAPGLVRLAANLSKYLCNTIRRRLWRNVKTVISSHSMDDWNSFLNVKLIIVHVAPLNIPFLDNELTPKHANELILFSRRGLAWENCVWTTTTWFCSLIPALFFSPPHALTANSGGDATITQQRIETCRRWTTWILIMLSNYRPSHQRPGSRISLLISTESLSAATREKLLRQFAVYTIILSCANVPEPWIKTCSVKFNGRTFIYIHRESGLSIVILGITPHSSAYWHVFPTNQPIPA